MLPCLVRGARSGAALQQVVHVAAGRGFQVKHLRAWPVSSAGQPIHRGIGGPVGPQMRNGRDPLAQGRSFHQGRLRRAEPRIVPPAPFGCAPEVARAATRSLLETTPHTRRQPRPAEPRLTRLCAWHQDLSYPVWDGEVASSAETCGHPPRGASTGDVGPSNATPGGTCRHDCATGAGRRGPGDRSGAEALRRPNSLPHALALAY